MYVHCHCRQQVWISTLLLSRGLHLQCKPRELNHGRIHKKTQTIRCTNTTLVLKTSVCSLCHHRALVGSGGYRQLWCWPVHKFSRCICHCIASCPCFAPCNCCHDPFLVRNAQTCPPFIGFTQLSHPSRCSRSTLTTVCFCAFDSSRAYVWSLVCVPRLQSPSS